MKTKIKLCGFTNLDTVNLAVSLGADFIGFVFHDSSSRNIPYQKAGEISAKIPKSTKKVAVIVDADDEKISQIITHLKPDFLQLHGHESPARILEIKNKFQVEVIKAFGISSLQDLQQVKNYEDVADLFLFDAKVSEYGGSGKSFDWQILQNLKTKKDWFLSGGLNSSNINAALRISKAKMLDVSSGIEEEKGIKSPTLIAELMGKLKKTEE